MEEKLILHKPITKPGKDDIILRLTDMQFHMKLDATENPAKRIEHAIDNNKPGRIYTSLSTPSNPNEIQTPFFNADDPEFQKLVKKYRDQGKRVFIMQPKSGLPIKQSKDVEEFINSKKGKRLLRKLNKDKSK